MRIIVEGCDGVGKTSFINHLKELTGMDVVKGSSFELSKDGSYEMFKKSKKMLLEEDNIILDRSFYSNAVYGPMYNYPTMTDDQFRELNEIAEEVAVVYYLTADTDIITERIERRGDDMISSSDIDDIKKNYQYIWERYNPKCLVEIDVSNIDLLDVDSEIYTKVLEHVRNNDKWTKDKFWKL